MSTGLLEPTHPTPSQPSAQRARGRPEPRRIPTYRKVLTAIVFIVPPLAALGAAAHVIGHGVPWMAFGLLVVSSFPIGFGVTVGFHRLFAHRSFEARRPLKIVLAVLGSLSFQGSLIDWVADHRRHHRHSDRPDDPHSPVWRGTEPLSGWRGLWHAHVGWCFTSRPTSREQYAPDLLADRDLVVIDRMFAFWCVASLAIPFAIGYVWSGTLAGALVALAWGGMIRIALIHHSTWSINSICHRFGKRPFDTRDQSTNVAALALLTLGESWHNNHHAFPRLARHGVDRRQLDSSARLIRWFEQLGLATSVNWPDPAQLAARRA